MALSFEQRFKSYTHLPKTIEWLSDNGPPYTAHETRRFGKSLGFIMCSNLSYSPQRNGLGLCEDGSGIGLMACSNPDKILRIFEGDKQTAIRFSSRTGYIVKNLQKLE